jgi:hypothetical protein
MKTKLLKSLYLALILITISGCSKNEDNPVTPEDDDQNNIKQWTIEAIVTEGTYPALVIDDNNSPHISYLDYSDGYVKYASRNANSWEVASVGKVSNVNGTVANGGISSIALDAANNPYITYYDYGNAQFKLATKNGNNWAITVIPLPNDPLMSYDSPFIPWEESSIVIDKQTGTAHISLQMMGGWSGQVLGYWRTGLATAVIVDGDDANSGYHNAIALDGNSRPGISYEARGSGELKFAYWNGTAFEKETVAPMPLIYWMERLTSIAFDTNNAPQIAFYGNGKYKYAQKENSGWTIKDLDYQSGYPAVCLSLDSNNSPHIALVTIDTGNAYRLKHAFLNGTQWGYENIEDNVNHCIVAVDQSDKIYIVYETDAGELQYAFK